MLLLGGSTLVLLATLSSNALAIPTPGHDLTKRANPQIGSNISPNQAARLLPDGSFENGFGNALELMYWTTGTDGNPEIFAKYFDQQDRPFVDAIFSRLLGEDYITGNPALQNITVEIGRKLGRNVEADLRRFLTPSPQLLLKEDVFVYPDLDSAGNGYDGKLDPCRTWDEEGLTLKMYTLGSIILHEYTHWGWLLQDIGGRDIMDQPNGYGLHNTRTLDHTLSKYNADSYAWWATENFWATKCVKAGGYDIL